MPLDNPKDLQVRHVLYAAAERLDLTERQLELLTLVTRGLSRPELAEEMSVSVAAIDYHGRTMRRRFGVGPRELALRLLRDALLEAHPRSAMCQPRDCSDDGSVARECRGDNQ